jgi:hypothetical protein
MAPRSFVPALGTSLSRTRSWIWLVILSLAGCSGPDPVGPLRQAVGSKSSAAEANGFGSGSFYPLAIGNAWSYLGVGSIRYITNGTPGDPLEVYAFTETRRLIGYTRHDETTYVIEEQIHHEVPEGHYGPSTFWSRMRQNAAGLFFLDTLLTSPPGVENGNAELAPGPSVSVDLASVPSGVRTNPALVRLAHRLELMRKAVRVPGRMDANNPTGVELTELLYPLKVGQNWSIRPDIPWPARVAGVEVLDTPAGRITSYRIDLDPFGTTIHEGEWVREWWSRRGWLGYSLHFLEEETDTDGQPTGRIFTADESMIVESLNISR